jgi:hypothetical protein
MNCNLNTFSGKYVSLIESQTPWYNSTNILLTKKNIKKNNKYPNNCECDKYLDLEECSCNIENMENIKKKELNKNELNNNELNNNELNNNELNNNELNKNELNKNIIKMILLIFFILIILNIIIK